MVCSNIEIFLNLNIASVVFIITIKSWLSEAHIDPPKNIYLVVILNQIIKKYLGPIISLISKEEKMSK